MDNPIDSPIDLGLVNYTRHPSNSEYVVFRFPDIERANDFEAQIQAAKIWFERDQEERKQRTYYLFGLHKNDFKRAYKINIEVESRHKKPIIPFAPLRWFVLVFGLGLLTLTLVGYCKQQEKLASYEKSVSSINDSTNRE